MGLRCTMAALSLTACVGGCRIVDSEAPCPSVEPIQLSEAAGPLAVLNGSVYYFRTASTFSRVPTIGGPITDLAVVSGNATLLAVNETDAYWATETGNIVRARLDGSEPVTVLTQRYPILALAVDGTGVEWSTDGLYRLPYGTTIAETLVDTGYIASLAAHAGSYFFGDAATGMVRRAPPLVDLATIRTPVPGHSGWLAADDGGVVYFTLTDATRGEIRFVAPDGSGARTLARDLSWVTQVVIDESQVFFIDSPSEEYVVQRVSRSGGDVTTLACGSGLDVHLAQDADFVYWSDETALYRIVKTL